MKGFAMTHSSIKVLSQKMMSLRPITFKRKFGFVLIHIQLGFWQARLKQSVFCKTLLLYIKRTFLKFKIRLHRKTQENNRTSNGIKEILDRDFLLLFIAFGVRHQKKGNWTNSRRFLSNYFFFFQPFTLTWQISLERKFRFPTTKQILFMERLFVMCRGIAIVNPTFSAITSGSRRPVGLLYVHF